MSIGRRLFNLARSELNSLLDRAVEAERPHSPHQDPDDDLYRRFSLDELSDAELEAEIERRYQARKAGAAGGGTKTEAPSPTGRPTGRPTGHTSSASASHPRQKSSPAPHAPPVDDELRRAYAALEVPVGADFATVRSSYRALMRKYHPDRHTGSPEKQKAATELAQKLTQAYELIEGRSRK